MRSALASSRARTSSFTRPFPFASCTRGHSRAATPAAIGAANDVPESVP